MQLIRPTDADELARALAEANHDGYGVEVVGSATKQGVGRPIEVETTITTRGLRGITLYEPTEMVISAFSGTPVANLEVELDKHNQRLAFEPIDLGPMLGGAAGEGTIGAVFATNLSGARRNYVGAARDHLLGIRAVNGRGEAFKSGGRVMKNVTGYDLCRGLAGSWGTLCVFTEVTMKALPQAEETRTLIISGQPDELAVELMCAAMCTPYEVSGTMHLQQSLVERMRNEDLNGLGTAITALRIENFSNSVAYRSDQLKKRFSAYGDIIELDHRASTAFWRELQQLSFLASSANPVWRISTAPRTAPRVVRAIAGYMDCSAAYDWSGGLVWLEVPASVDAGAADIRRVIATNGGHATLIRAERDVRQAVEVFQPLETGLARLTRGLKAAFDPAGILNPGRMYGDV